MNYLKIILCLVVIFSLEPIGFCSGKLEPRIVRGEGFLSKSLFYDGSSVSHSFRGGVATIQQGKFCNFAPGKEIAIMGSLGLVIVDEQTGAWRMTVKYEQGGVMSPAIVDIKGDNFKIMNRGGGYSNVRLLDHNGKTLWVYRPRCEFDLPPSGMVAGDLDRDGELEFYAEGCFGLHRVNGKGEKVWERIIDRSLVQDVEIYDYEEETKPLIVTRCQLAKGHTIRFWDHAGTLVREVKPEMAFYDIKLIRWRSSQNILAGNGHKIYVLDFDGKILFQYKLKRYFSFFDIFGIYGTPVTLEVGESPYLAVITKFRSSSDRSMLNVFSYDGELVYQELLKRTTGICAVKSDSSGKEVLFVGDGQKVWKYELAGGNNLLK